MYKPTVSSMSRKTASASFATSIIMMMEDAKIYNKDIYIMYADFNGAFNAADRGRIRFKYMRILGMPSTFVDKREQLYGVSTTDYITSYGSTPSIDNNRGTLQGDTMTPFLFTLFLEPFFLWLTVGSRGYRRGAPTTKVDPTDPITTYPGHGFADDLSHATGSPTNMSIQLQKLSLFNAYTWLAVNIRKCSITCAPWSSGNALSLTNRTLLSSRLQKHFGTINTYKSPIPSIYPSESSLGIVPCPRGRT
jgi:hypothetical protein